MSLAIERGQAALRLAPTTSYVHVLLARDLIARADLGHQSGAQDRPLADRETADKLLIRALQLDPESCLVKAGLSLTPAEWSIGVANALSALHRQGCRASADHLTGHSQEIAVAGLLRAFMQAGAEMRIPFSESLRGYDAPHDTLDLLMAMARRYLAEGRDVSAEPLLHLALAVWPEEARAAYPDLVSHFAEGHK